MKVKNFYFGEHYYNDLINGISYYKEIDFDLGTRFYTKVEEAVEEVKLNPIAFPKKKYHLRENLIKKFPYILYYRIDGENLYFLTIACAIKKPYYWLKE